MLRSEPDSNGNIASLYWAVFDGAPRIVVKTNVKDDENINYGKIVAPIDLNTAIVIVNILKSIKSKEPDWKIKVTVKSSWHNGAQLEKPEQINEIIIGKNADNEAYICVHEKNRPLFKFFFGPTNWHTLVKANGEGFTRAELSEMFAIAYAEALKGMILTTVGYGSYVSAYADFDNIADGKPTFSNQGPQNSYSGNNNNRGNWNNRSGGNRGNWSGNRGNRGNWSGNRGGGGYQQNRQQSQQQPQQEKEESFEDIDF